MAKAKKEIFVKVPALLGHGHRCPLCGEWYRHDDPKCPLLGLAWKTCLGCAAFDGEEMVYWSRVAEQLNRAVWWLESWVQEVAEFEDLDELKIQE